MTVYSFRQNAPSSIKSSSAQLHFGNFFQLHNMYIRTLIAHTPVLTLLLLFFTSVVATKGQGIIGLVVLFVVIFF